MEMGFSGWTHTGLVRKNNEDCFRITPSQPGGSLFLVADGIGGNAGGEIASQIAADTVSEAFASSGKITENECRMQMEEAFQAAHRTIKENAAQNLELEDMGTTMTALVLHNGQGHVFHVGDSRLYHYQNRVLKQITRDHTLIGEWLRDEKITSEEARHHPYRNMLTRALGIEPLDGPDYYRITLVPGDVVLLCTDGLTNMVDDARIQEIIAGAWDTKSLCERLGEEGLRNGGHDNITVIAVAAGSGKK